MAQGIVAFAWASLRWMRARDDTEHTRSRDRAGGGNLVRGGGKSKLRVLFLVRSPWSTSPAPAQMRDSPSVQGTAAEDPRK